MGTAVQDAQAPAKARRPLWTSAWVFALVLAVLGFGFLASRPAPPPQHPELSGGAAAARQAVSELLTPGAGQHALAALPDDFSAVTGVQPALEQAPDGTARAVHAGGGCSTPWGDDGTRSNFSVACKTHDLGYDLLRYAAAKGQPLGPSLRRALDERLSADMYTTCRINPQGATRTCELAAWLYTAGLVVNSWHQRWGPLWCSRWSRSRCRWLSNCSASASRPPLPSSGSGCIHCGCSACTCSRSPLPH